MSPRPKWILVTGIGILFVILGIAILVSGDEPVMALAVILFFGAVAAVGIAQLFPQRTGLGVMAGAALALGVACALLAIVLLVDPDGGLASRRYPTPFMVGIGIVGAIFFGGGGIALLMRRNAQR